MSVHYVSPVWKMDLPTSAKIVLLKFADNATDDGFAWPKISTVARETGLAERTVQNHLRAFEGAGVLVSKKGGKGGRAPDDEDGKRRGATTRYWIDIERAKDLYRPGKIDYDAESKGASDAPLDSGSKGASDDAKGASDDAKGASDDNAYIEEPSSEPSSEPARAREAVGREDPASARALGEANETKPPPACAEWNRNLARLRAAIGARDWATWVEGAIPLADDGDELVLALPSRMIADHVKEVFGETIESILGRRLRCVPAPAHLVKAIDARRHEAEQERNTSL